MNVVTSANEADEMIQDIASLMLMLHETYISHLEKLDVLKGLLSFLYDCGLLCNRYLSLIETERIRQKIMECIPPEDSLEEEVDVMSSWRFYYWLREISCLVYHDHADGGRGALHRLLTRHVFPAKSICDSSYNQRLNIFNLLDNSALKWILQFEDFFRLWYCTMILEVRHSRSTIQIWLLWEQIVDQDLALSWTVICNHLALLKVCPGMIEEKDLHEVFDRFGNDGKKFSFTDFLIIFCLIVKKCEEKQNLVRTLSVDDVWNMIFEQIADSMFATLVELMTLCQHQHTCLLSPSKTSCSSPTKTSNALKSFLWLLRQARIVNLLHDLPKVISLLFYPSQGTKDSEIENVQVHDLKQLTSTFVQSMPSLGFCDSAKVALNVLKSSMESYLVNIALYSPAILFVIPSAVPKLLDELYSQEALNSLLSLQKSCNHIWQNCLALHKASVKDITSVTVNLHSVLLLCDSTQLIPELTSLRTVLKAYNYLLPSAASTSHDLDYTDLLELLFVLSQIVYDGDVKDELEVNVEHVVLKPHEGSFRNFKAIIDFLTRELNEIESRMVGVVKAHNEKNLHLSSISLSSDSFEGIARTSTVLATILLGDTRDFLVAKICHLLCHYPMNSDHFGAWNIYLYKNNQFQNLSDSASIIEYVLTTFSIRFSIPGVDICSFIESITSSKQMLLPNLGSFLSDHFMAEFSQVEILNTLKVNVGLMLWEFFRCYLRNRFACIYFNDSMFQLPTLEMFHSCPADVMVTVKAAVSWAVEICCISKTDARQCLIHTLSPTGKPILRKLTFSHFLIFSLRCFTFTCFDASKIESPKKTFNECLKGMLESFSRTMSQFQQMMKLRVVKLLLLGDRTEDRVVTLADSLSDQIILDDDSRQALVIASLNVFDFFYSRKGIPTDYSAILPQRLSAERIDAPKFVEICKFFGLVNVTGSFACCWFAYLRYIKENCSHLLISQADTIVPSLDIPLNESCLLGLIKCAISLLNELRSNGAVDDKLDFDWVIANILLPSATAAIDKQLVTNTERKHESISPDLEDLLRYGGHTILKTLNKFSATMQSIYLPADQPGTEGPLISEVCRYLEKTIFLSFEDIKLLCMQAVHTRPHSSNDYSACDGNMQFIEFQDLFIRCAFKLWIQSGAVHGKPIPSNFNVDSNKMDVNDRLRFADSYCQYCDELLASTALATISWGTDFFSPMMETMTSDWKAGALFVLSEVRHVLPSIEIESNDPLQLNFDNFDSHESLETLAINISSSLSPAPSSSSTSCHLEPKITDITPDFLNNMVHDMEVIARGDKLLSSILSLRQPSTASPRMIKAQDKRHVLQQADGSLPLALSSPSSKSSNKTVLSSQERWSARSIENTTMFVLEIDALLDGTKEALWPVFLTYCSCGDSLNPGKISGPNLFTLLSKLGVLNDRTALSDVGILLHQISAHSLHLAPISTIAFYETDKDIAQSPSLSFEEFLVFLCAFSQLYYEGVVVLPTLADKEPQAEDKILGGRDTDGKSWYESWLHFMKASHSFRQLLEERILPLLSRQLLLAFPEDARHRDRYDILFSLQVVLTIERFEKKMKLIFESNIACGSYQDGYESELILKTLTRLGLYPKVIESKTVTQLIADVLPQREKNSSTNQSNKNLNMHMAFPQLEWLLAVVAFEVARALSHTSKFDENDASGRRITEMLSEITDDMMPPVGATL